ncbi:lauroyl acyltransferase [Sessilibacter sp. MAH1]
MAQGPENPSSEAQSSNIKSSDTKADSNRRRNRRNRATDDSAAIDLKGNIAVALYKSLSILPLSTLRALGGLVGKFLWATNGSAAKVTRENIGYAYPGLSSQEQLALSKQSVIESARTFTELAKIWTRDDVWLEKHFIEVENKERFLQHVNDERGLIILGPHLGNWEVMGRCLGIFCPVVTAMYQPVQLPAMDAMIKSARSINMKMAPTDRRGVMQVMKALKNNETVGILPDQLPLDGGGEFADFFGKPALTMTLIRQLQQKTGAAVMMAFAKRIKGGYRIIFKEPHTDIYSEDPAVAVAGLNKSVELCVNVVPEQYQWEYKRYRRQPEGLPRPYQF